MKCDEVNDHGVTASSMAQVKKPWVTPSLEIIGLESAEAGHRHNGKDGGLGGSVSPPYS